MVPAYFHLSFDIEIHTISSEKTTHLSPSLFLQDDNEAFSGNKRMFPCFVQSRGTWGNSSGLSTRKPGLYSWAKGVTLDWLLYLSEPQLLSSSDSSAWIMLKKKKKIIRISMKSVAYHTNVVS